MTPALWKRRTLAVMALASLVGLVALVVAANGASGEVSLAAQIGWLNLAVAGSIIAGTGQASLLIAGRRMVTLRREQVVEALTSASTRSSAEKRPDVTAVVVSRTRVAVANGTWHHDPACVLVTGKPTQPIPSDTPMPACTICGVA